MPFYNIHTHYAAQAAEERVLRNAYMYAQCLRPVPYALSAGLHPWFTGGDIAGVRHNLYAALQNPQVKALGECGLDRLKGPPLPEQMRFLEMQKELAHEVVKPLLIHCVRAYDELFALLKDCTVPVILHDYQAGEVMSRRFLQYPQFFFSLGRGLLRAAPKHVKAYAIVPQQRILFETDSLRIPVREIYQRYTSLYGYDPEELKQTIGHTVQRLWPGGL